MENRNEMERAVELEELKVECSCCGEMVDATDCRIVSGEFVCDDCISDHYYYCEHCDSLVYEDDVVWFGDSPYCPDCADDLFIECYDCGDLIDRDDCFITADGRYICYDCRDDYTFCRNCDGLYPNDNIYWDGKSGFVYAREQLHAGSLLIHPGRRRHYGKIDPAESRKIFIR